MFIIDKTKLKKIIENNFEVLSFESFFNSLQRFLLILNDTTLLCVEFDILFNDICKKCNRSVAYNRILVFSIDGCIGAGKTTFIQELIEQKNLNNIEIKNINNENDISSNENEISFLDEPLAIWQCIYHNDYEGLNLIEIFYESLTSPCDRNSKFPFYFQTIVIFSRWLILAYTKSNIFITERSVFSDRF
jgi:hypothetical protein